MTTQTTAPKPPPLWRNPDYMLLWGGQFVSTLGSGISGIVIPLLILSLTNSPAAAGFAAALRSVPYLIFSLPLGALIDRWDRKRVMVWCDVGRALTMASIPLAMAFGVLTIWQLYLVELIEGSLFVFFNIAEVAVVPRVVPRAQLPSATAQNQAAYAVADIVGPGTGTYLFHTIGQAFPFIADAVSYTLSAASLIFMRVPFQSEQAPTQLNLLAQVKEGVSWLRRQPLVLFMSLLTGGMRVAGSAHRLLLIVLAQQLGASDDTIGLIFSIAAVGGIVGTILGGRAASRFSFAQVIIGCVWVHVIVFPFYAIAPNVWVLGALTMLLYFVMPSYDIVQFSYRLALIPDRLQGRVNSVWRLIAFGGSPLGAALCGISIERFGAVPTVIFFSLWQLFLGILTLRNTHVRHALPIEQVRAVG